MFLRRTINVGGEVIERETIACQRVKNGSHAVLALHHDGTVITEFVIQPERGRVVQYYEMNEAGDTLDRYTDHSLAGYPHGTDFTRGEFPGGCR